MGGAGFRGVLAVPEFRALWSAELLSVAGDQLARVGLAVLVFTETDSAGLTALTYALTFLPALIGGVLLGGLADRYPRRELMVVVDLSRAAMAGLMAIPSLPLPVLLGLVFLLTLGGAPFKAAQQALLPSVLSGERYVAGLALRTVTNQSAQVAGFLGGGALVAVVEPHLALGLNGVTFLVGALVLLVGVRYRPAARGADAERSGGAARLIWRDPVLRGLTALSWLAGLFVVPEGLAAPYAAGLGVPVAAVGLLMAAVPVGSILGGWLVARVGPRHRERATSWFAVAAGVPLALCGFDPPLAVVTALWAASGMFATGYLVLAQASFVLAVPDRHRGAASGLAGAGVLSSQGVAVLGAGILADMTSPVLAVAAGGVAGIALTGLVGAPWLRARTRQGRAPVGPGGRETDDVDQDDELTSPSSATSRTPPLHKTAADNGDRQIARHPEITSPSCASLAPPSRTAATNDGDRQTTRHPEITSPSSASLAPPSHTAATNGDEQTHQPTDITSPNYAPHTPPSHTAATNDGNRQTTRHPEITSPNYAPHTPPFQTRAANSGNRPTSEHTDVTSPNSARRTPPSKTPATGNGNQSTEITSPNSASRTPPSKPAATNPETALTNPSYAPHTPPSKTPASNPGTTLTNPSSASPTPPFRTVATEHVDLTNPNYASRTPPSTGRQTTLASPGYTTSATTSPIPTTHRAHLLHRPQRPTTATDR